MAADAIEIDNSYLSREEQFAQVLNWSMKSLKRIIICRYHFLMVDLRLINFKVKKQFIS
jgi:hypothetical protein